MFVKKKKKSSAALGKSLHFQLNVLKDRGIKRSLAIYIKCKKNITNMILRENKYRLLERTWGLTLKLYNKCIN